MTKLTAAVQRGDRWGGSDGETYKISAGQVWQVDKHLFCCSDLMASELLDECVDTLAPKSGIDKATLLYCDPPWGQGLVNSFRTKAGLEHATYRWEELYRRIADIGHHRGMPVWLEGSVMESRDGKKILGTMVPLNADQRNWYWQIEYANHQPAGLYYSSTVPPPPSLKDALKGLHDKHTPATVMGAYPHGVVVDPSVGLGGTPFNAAKVGWGSINNEMNPYRMSSSLVRLEKATGEQAVRLR